MSPQPSPASLDDGRIDFTEGATWQCTSCGSPQTVVDDDEGTGLPAHYDPARGVAVCDACAGRPADTEPQEP
jgi:rubredoxin